MDPRYPNDPWRNYNPAKENPVHPLGKRYMGWQSRSYACRKCKGPWAKDMVLMPERWYWTKIRKLANKYLKVWPEPVQFYEITCARCGHKQKALSGTSVMLVNYKPDRDA